MNWFWWFLICCCSYFVGFWVGKNHDIFESWIEWLEQKEEK